MPIDILELGGGEYPEYHPNIDIIKNKYVDVLADFEMSLPFKSESIKKVFSSHTFEHISWRNQRELVQEIHRILVPEGEIEIIVPDGEFYMSVLLWGKVIDHQILGCLLGGQLKRTSYDFHKTIFTEKLIDMWFSPFFFYTINKRRMVWKGHTCEEYQLLGVKK